MFAEKNLGKCTVYIGIAVMPRLCGPAFHFHQFSTNVTNTFGKNYLRITSQLKMANSGGLVCRWASVNDLVQNKFRSIIHLLSQHLLDQSHRRKHQMNVQDLLKINNKDTRTK